MNHRFAMGLVVSTCLLIVSFAAKALAADPPPILQSVIVDTNGNTDAFVDEATRTRAIFKRLGIQARRRYFQATLAGEAAGTVALVIEYPNLAAHAAAVQKLQNDDEWQAYIDRLTKKGVSIQSNSIWVELAP